MQWLGHDIRGTEVEKIRAVGETRQKWSSGRPRKRVTDVEKR